jgi:hypothetical protein
MSQGCDTPKTQIPKPKPETIRNQNYPKLPKPKLIQIPKPKTQMFWVSFGIGTYLDSCLIKIGFLFLKMDIFLFYPILVRIKYCITTFFRLVA